MAKITKVLTTTADAIAEMELEKLYQKSLGSELSLEDTKKYDILVKNMREGQKDATKDLEERFQELRKQMMQALPTQALEQLVESNPGPDTDDTQSKEQSDQIASENDFEPVD